MKFPAFCDISHARKGIEFATSIILHIKGMQLKNGKNLQVKIGVNSGQVIKGWLDTTSPSFPWLATL